MGLSLGLYFFLPIESDRDHQLALSMLTASLRKNGEKRTKLSCSGQPSQQILTLEGRTRETLDIGHGGCEETTSEESNRKLNLRIWTHRRFNDPIGTASLSKSSLISRNSNHAQLDQMDELATHS